MKSKLSFFSGRAFLFSSSQLFFVSLYFFSLGVRAQSTSTPAPPTNDSEDIAQQINDFERRLENSLVTPFSFRKQAGENVVDANTWPCEKKHTYFVDFLTYTDPSKIKAEFNQTTGETKVWMNLKNASLEYDYYKMDGYLKCFYEGGHARVDDMSMELVARLLPPAPGKNSPKVTLDKINFTHSNIRDVRVFDFLFNLYPVFLSTRDAPRWFDRLFTQQANFWIGTFAVGIFKDALTPLTTRALGGLLDKIRSQHSPEGPSDPNQNDVDPSGKVKTGNERGDSPALKH